MQKLVFETAAGSGPGLLFALGDFSPGGPYDQGGFPGDPLAPPPMGPGYPGQPSYSPMGPGPEKSSTWKYVLIGCGCLLLLAIAGIGGSCAYVYYKGPPIFARMMGLAKTEYVNNLSPDHTQEQKERFERNVDAFIDSMETGKYSKFGGWDQEFMDLLSGLTKASNKQMTVEESQKWCDEVENLLGENEEPPSSETE